MFLRHPLQVDKFVFGILFLFSIKGLVDAANVTDNRQKRAVSCEAKYMEITPGHTACLEPSNTLNQNRKGVSNEDKQLILDMHNTARGGVSPSATNMMLMSWDDEIANTAQRWAEGCVFDHDGNYKRYAFGRFAVGQNLAIGQTDWTQAINDWEDEKNDYVYGAAATAGVVTGHYTQMIWATSSLIGCGYAQCGIKNYYVCNYGPAGNSNNEKPYESGVTCAACPTKCKNGLCDCAGRVCLNGGTMDWNTCICNCREGLTFFLAPTCGLNCDLNEESELCNLYGADKCEKFTNVPQECPITCRWCPTAAHKPNDRTTTTTTFTSTTTTTSKESSTRPTDEPVISTTATASAVISNKFVALAVVFALVLVL